MQHDTALDLIGARRSDSFQPVRDLTRATQVEILLVAYLLTGDRDRARGLAMAAYRRLCRELRSIDPDADLRLELFARMTRCFVLGEYDVAARTTSATELDPRDGRHRVLAELGRMDAHERLALVLSSISGFDLRDLNRMLSHDDAALTTRIATTTHRFRRRLDIAEAESVRATLLEASLGRARDDLWPEVESMLVAGRRTVSRRRRMVGIGAAAATLLIALFTVAAVFANDVINGGSEPAHPAAEPRAVPVASDTLSLERDLPPTPAPELTVPAAGNVPATLFARVQHAVAEGETPLTTFNVIGRDNEILMDAGATLEGGTHHDLMISSDGGTLVAIHDEWTDESVTYHVTALDSATFEVSWQVEIGEFALSAVTRRNATRVSATVGSKRLYLALVNDEELDVIRLSAFDLETGDRHKTMELDIESALEADTLSHQQATLSLRLTPDESRLYLTLTIWDMSSAWREHRATTFPMDLPTLTLPYPGAYVTHSDDRYRDVYWHGLSMSPRGDTLYGYLPPDAHGPARYQFINLDDDRVSAVDLPFTMHPEINRQFLTQVLSHDGRRIYAIDSFTGEVAVVNLVEQRTERLFGIDTGEYGAMFGDHPGQLVYSEAHALALDGTRLYVGARSYDEVLSGRARPESGVWVIDLHEWKIVDFQPVDGRIIGMHRGAGPADLFVRYWHHAEPDDEQSTHSLDRLDWSAENVSVERIDSELDTRQHWSFWSTLDEIYRGQHGRSPSVDEFAPRDIEDYTTLPRFDVTFPEHVASGVNTSMEVRVLHPASGEVMHVSGGGVRFNPDSLLMAHLRAEEQPGQVVVLVNVEPGVYRGGVTLPADGVWSVDIIVAEPGSGNTVSSGAGLVDVGPTFAGSDGNLYQFRISTDPRQPVVDEEALVRLRIVNVETGERLPLDVDLNVELPPRIDVALANPELVTGYRTVLLYQTAHNAYEAGVTFQFPGDWQTTMRLYFPGEPRVEAPGGTIEVLDSD